MICDICNSDNIDKIYKFKPYNDIEFEFNIYDCLNCQTRFAKSLHLDYDKTILHSNVESPYLEHYKKANEVKELLKNNLNQFEYEFLQNDLLLKKVLMEIDNFNDKNISILEIGCSTGYITAFLQAKGYKNAFGIDISHEPIEYAKKTFGNFYATKEEDKKYDIIFFTGVIGCVSSPMEFLNYYLEFLTKKGVMLFNAPDVDSVKETNETWVSSPPPDVIFLFQRELFLKSFEEKYEIGSYKTFTPINILFKYLNKFRRKKNNQYPRNFYTKNRDSISLSSSKLKKIVKKIIVLIIKILLNLKVLKKYSDEYGLIYKIQKKDNINE